MSKLLNCLNNKDHSYVPIWFMRQAGRYLPEFRKIRSHNPNFLKLCFNSSLASEISLQPIKRFDLDAAIIFSDILIVLNALGQEVDFNGTDGPKIKNFKLEAFLEIKKEKFLKKLDPVYKAINLTRASLKPDKSLIGFIGAPWTLIIYLLNLKKGNKISQNDVNKNKRNIKLIINKLNEFLTYHIEYQVKAGADVVQIFDSWAGLIEKDQLEDWCYKPNRNLVNYSKSNKIPVICFPKGLQNNYKEFVNSVKPNGISIDSDLDPSWVKNNLNDLCIQGGVNPELLLKEEKNLILEIEKYLEIFKNNPYIFNLGHGILPQTNPEVVKKVIEKVKNFKK